MFDTHCHLNIDPLNKNIDLIIKDAKDFGVNYLLVPGTTFESSRIAVNIAQKHENVFAAIGIHPTDEKKLQNSKILKLQEFDLLIGNPKVLAIGEIGLDYFKNNDKDNKEYQKELFIDQLEYGIKHKKSIIIHCREASDDVLSILNTNWSNWFLGRMVFHCCEPSKTLLDFAKDKKIFIGVDGDITYKKEKQDFIKEVPLDLLVLETDAPFLTPDPVRKTLKFPNEPKNLNLINKFISNILNTNEEDLKKITFNNSRKLFNL